MGLRNKRNGTPAAKNGAAQKVLRRNPRLNNRSSPSVQGSPDTEILTRRSARIQTRASSSVSLDGNKPPKKTPKARTCSRKAGRQQSRAKPDHSTKPSPSPEIEYSSEGKLVVVTDIKITKIYMDHGLYSIFDRRTKTYIYKRDRDGDEDFLITYSDNARCTSIQNANGEFVYRKPEGHND